MSFTRPRDCISNQQESRKKSICLILRKVSVIARSRRTSLLLACGWVLLLCGCQSQFISSLTEGSEKIASTDDPTAPETPPAPLAPPPLPTTAAALPTVIGDNMVLNLDCGKIYYGTLNLSGHSNVTLQTAGDCGRAVITPAVPVTGWTLYKDQIYVAAVDQEVAQVLINGQLASLAHYPNSLKESGWLQPSSVTETSMTFSGLPNNDIVGAKATYRGNYPWAIGTRTITAYDGQTLTLPAPTNSDLISEDSPLGKFYLEGKLWMLDSPGEWAWADGKLYVWMPDGKAPGAQVLAAPDTYSTVDVQGSSGITINNVRIYGGWIGIDASFSDIHQKSTQDFHLLNSEVAFSDWSGIYATDAQGLTVDNSDIVGSLHTGIYSRYGSNGTVVKNSRFTNVNTIGMHKGSDGTIFLNSDQHASVLNNTITNAGKSGIFMGESSDSVVQGNKIYGACRIHGDCGGIYTFDRGKVLLNTRIVGNYISDVNGDPVRPGSDIPERYGIYLDDFSMGVTVDSNIVTHGDSGMMLHMAANNIVEKNSFSNNSRHHVLFVEDSNAAGSLRDNTFSGNTFEGPDLAFRFVVPDPSKAAIFQQNTYLNYGNSPVTSPAGVPYQ